MIAADVRVHNHRSRRRRLIRKVLVLGTCLALILGVGLPSEVISGGRGGFPLPSLWPWSKGQPDVWSGKAFDGLPKQRDGGQAAGSAQVSSDATRGNRGAGLPAGKGTGALLAEQRAAKQVQQYTTGKAAGGKGAFNERTSKRIAKDATAVSDVFANADGSFTRRLYDQPTNVRAANGTWQPIDRSLIAGSGGRYVGRLGADDRDFAPRAADPRLVTVRFGARPSPTACRAPPTWPARSRATQ